MKIRSIVLLLVASISMSSAVGGRRQGDSVDSSAWRNRSSVPIGGAGPGVERYYPIYENVPLGILGSGDYFTNFGPFANDSAAAKLRITVRRTGTSPKGGLVGWHNQVKVADDFSAISVLAGPGEEISFAAKDTASISIYSTVPGQRAADLGLPSAVEFTVPTGKYVSCFAVLHPETQQEIGHVYFYEAGSMSDRSMVTWDLLSQALTLGPPPQSRGPCGPWP